MSNCLQAARFFIVQAYEDGREHEITNMKVQKLLYYTQSLHLALFDEPWFPEEIQAWRYGPVCPDAYRSYSKFEADQLPIPDRDDLSDIEPQRLEVLQEVWDYFGQYNAYYLSGMTHVEFPWKKARRGFSAYERSTEVIALEDMQLLGNEKLRQIEREHPDYQRSLSYLLETASDESDRTPEYIPEGGVHDWLTSLLT